MVCGVNHQVAVSDYSQQALINRIEIQLQFLPQPATSIYNRWFFFMLRVPSLVLGVCNLTSFCSSFPQWPCGNPTLPLLTRGWHPRHSADQKRPLQKSQHQ